MVFIHVVHIQNKLEFGKIMLFYVEGRQLHVDTGGEQPVSRQGIGTDKVPNSQSEVKLFVTAHYCRNTGFPVDLHRQMPPNLQLNWIKRFCKAKRKQ